MIIVSAYFKVSACGECFGAVIASGKCFCFVTKERGISIITELLMREIITREECIFLRDEIVKSDIAPDIKSLSAGDSLVCEVPLTPQIIKEVECILNQTVTPENVSQKHITVAI